MTRRRGPKVGLLSVDFGLIESGFWGEGSRGRVVPVGRHEDMQGD